MLWRNLLQWRALLLWRQGLALLQLPLPQLWRKLHTRTQLDTQTLAPIKQVLVWRGHIVRFLRLTQAFARFLRTPAPIERAHQLLCIGLDHACSGRRRLLRHGLFTQRISLCKARAGRVVIATIFGDLAEP